MNLELAQRLSALRRAHGLSQEDLAAELGVSRQAVSKWERAESSPDTDNLIALARRYGVSLDELVFRREEPAARAEQAQPQQAQAQQAQTQQAQTQQTQARQTQAPQADEDAEILEAAARWDAADEAVSRKRRSRWRRRLLLTPYPLIVTLVYLALGFSLGWWHPGWMLYLTIPIYYCVAGAL